MNNFIFFTISLMLMSPTWAEPPSDTSVNQSIIKALTLDWEDLKSQDGPYQCTGPNGVSFRGQSIKEAHDIALLYCIRKRCDGVQSEVNAEIDRLREMGSFELEDLLTALGSAQNMASVSEILSSGGYGGTTSCESSQLARYLAFDGCIIQASLQPYDCN